MTSKCGENKTVANSRTRGTAECVASTDQTHMERKEISSSNTTLPIRFNKKITNLRVNGESTIADKLTVN